VRQNSERRFAVLVLVDDFDGAPRVLFTLRPQREGDPYSGHVCFPGGGLEPSDASLAACALRETEEEIGIPSTQIEILTCGLDTPTRDGQPVTPFLARLACPLELRPNPAEVAEVLWLPGHRIAPELFARQSIRIGDRVIESPAFSLAGRQVWGLTARILASLYETTPELGALIRSRR
jgi:8-oxo-dGTP pyrophosphatase MutT (NUDIX family)